MLFIPLPFVNALFLALLFAMLVRNNGARSTRMFLVLIALCIAQSVTIGLRWGYGLTELHWALPLFAAVVPPVTFEAFRGLVHGHAKRGPIQLAPAALSLGCVLLALVVWPAALDLLLISLFCGFSIALLLLARSGPDTLRYARLDGAIPAHRAVYLAAGCLFASALFDAVILLDFETTNGANAALLIGNANVLSLLLIGFAAVAAGKTQTERLAASKVSVKETASATNADLDVAERVDTLMADEQLFKDEDLNLAKLARRLGLPARQVSQAINKAKGTNVSRYVNTYRVEEACRLLQAEDVTVTEIMFRSGFATKSNFNREFLRVTGMTPENWRKEAQDASA